MLIVEKEENVDTDKDTGPSRKKNQLIEAIYVVRSQPSSPMSLPKSTP